MEGGIVWKLADILNGMMAFPNLIALLFPFASCICSDQGVFC
jgi:Na+/alanine symporter